MWCLGSRWHGMGSCWERLLGNIHLLWWSITELLLFGSFDNPLFYLQPPQLKLYLTLSFVYVSICFLSHKIHGFCICFCAEELQRGAGLQALSLKGKRGLGAIFQGQVVNTRQYLEHVKDSTTGMLAFNNLVLWNCSYWSCSEVHLCLRILELHPITVSGGTFPPSHVVITSTFAEIETYFRDLDVLASFLFLL